MNKLYLKKHKKLFTAPHSSYMLVWYPAMQLLHMESFLQQSGEVHSLWRYGWQIIGFYLTKAEHDTTEIQNYLQISTVRHAQHH